MVESQFSAFKYGAAMQGDDQPFLFPLETVYLRLANNKITLEDTG